MVKKGASKLIRYILPENGISRQRGLTMLFSFLLASTLWFLVIINQKDHRSSFVLPIFIHNLPSNVDYIKPVPREVEVGVEGFGVDLLVKHFRFQPDTVHLYYSSDKEYILTRDYFSQIAQKTPTTTHIKVLDVSPDTLPILYEHRSLKRVKLFSNAQFKLAANFQKENQRIIRPDSVSISGPLSMLDTISRWYTAKRSFLISKERERFILPIDTLEGIKVDPTTAIIEVEARLYTQKQVAVSIRITDLPEKTSIHLSQESIQLSCLVPMKEFSKLHSTYLFEIPFNQLDEGVPYFIPEVEKILPQFVKIVTRNPLQLDFVILKKIN